MSSKALLVLLIITISSFETLQKDNGLSYDDFINGDIGVKVDGQHGWLPVNGKKGNDAFFWYVKNQQGSDDAPLFIVTPNGSGKSILASYFTTFGQEILKPTHTRLVKNHYAFNKYADLLMVDVPIGTGFSRYSDISQIPQTIQQKVNHFHTFLNNFFDKYDHLRKRELYFVSELRGTQMTPLYALKTLKSHFNVKGLISISNLSNPWIDHLSYAPNLEYKRITKKGKKLYEKMSREAKFCNMFSILGAPNASSYCTNLNDLADEHVLDIFGHTAIKVNFDPNTKVNPKEKRVEMWMNTEKVQKYFGLNQKWSLINPIVYKVVSNSESRVVATDAIINALLNRGVQHNIVVGSLNRTANWIGALMSATRLKWAKSDDFMKADWKLWNRKNDLKEVKGLRFARVFGRGYDFLATDTTEVSIFINEYVLGKDPTRNDFNKPGLTPKKDLFKFKSGKKVKNILKENAKVREKQSELANKTELLSKTVDDVKK